ncbi:NUDIX domain-containing protein [Candidatus Saccharibacteria bacterium]|nr:NUDIX domain-containing protein [Candidatus Saccharibacteria bacterium]
MKEKITYQGRIIEVVEFDGGNGKTFEKARRAPGSRLIIVSAEGQILITKEHRHELEQVDLRLPGGKVYDTLTEYNEALKDKTDIAESAKAGAIKEAAEETGLTIKNPELITVATAGATVDWDLYYFIVREYRELPTGQQLEHGEDIEVTWMSPKQIRLAIAGGQMQEWRSVGVLLGKVLPELEG